MDEVTRAVAAERRDIAGRLHDGPIQQLTAAQLFFDTALMQMADDARHPLLVRGHESLRDAIASCRALMRELAGDEDP